MAQRDKRLSIKSSFYALPATPTSLWRRYARTAVRCTAAQQIATFCHLHQESIYGVISSSRLNYNAPDLCGFLLPQHIKLIYEYKLHKITLLTLKYVMPSDVWNSLNLQTEQDVRAFIMIVGDFLVKPMNDKELQTRCGIELSVAFPTWCALTHTHTPR